MKFIIICVCVTYVYAQNQVITPKTVVRDLPANVNSGAPNQCWASTQNKGFPEGQSWSLKPHCGKATCGKGPQGLVERVEDCGQKPKPSPGCQIVNEADGQKEFPECCPKYQCQPGAQLLFPSEAELKAEFEAARSAAARGVQGQPQGRPQAQG